MQSAGSGATREHVSCGRRRDMHSRLLGCFASLVLAVVTMAAAQSAGLKIVVIEGEHAVNIIQQKTAVAPIVEVRDRNGQPVSGAVVTFTIRSSRLASFAGGNSTLTVATDAAGRAAVNLLNPLGSGQLQIQVSAAFEGQAASATIVQTNVMTATQAAAAMGAGAGVSGAVIAGVVGAVGAGTVVAVNTLGGGEGGGTSASGSAAAPTTAGAPTTPGTPTTPGAPTSPGTPTPGPSPTVLSISITIPDILVAGNAEQATATATLSNGSTQPVSNGSWDTGNGAIASVDGDGRVTPSMNGRTSVRVSSGGVTASREIRVVPNYQRAWSGTYRVVTCVATGDWGPFVRGVSGPNGGRNACATYFPGFVRGVAMTLTQARDVVTGRVFEGASGGLTSNPFTASIESDGALTFKGNSDHGGLNPIILADWRVNSIQPGEIVGASRQTWTARDVSGQLDLVWEIVTMR
jgi:hypothetical protein